MLLDPCKSEEVTSSVLCHTLLPGLQSISASVLSLKVALDLLYSLLVSPSSWAYRVWHVLQQRWTLPRYHGIIFFLTLSYHHNLLSSFLFKNKTPQTLMWWDSETVLCIESLLSHLEQRKVVLPNGRSLKKGYAQSQWAKLKELTIPSLGWGCRAPENLTSCWISYIAGGSVIYYNLFWEIVWHID